MSETPEKEIEIVAGVIEGVIQKKPDTWQVEVRPDGSQYTKKLWTKDAELVGALAAKLGQAGAFVCSASYWTNQSGTQVRSLWINQEGLEGVTVEAPQPTPEAAVALAHVESRAKPQNRSYAPDLKDRMIVRQTALKVAGELFSGWPTSAADESDAALEVMKAAARFETWVYRDIDPVPFAPDLSEHDQEIPY